MLNNKDIMFMKHIELTVITAKTAGSNRTFSRLIQELVKKKIKT